jgi:hypothetical protein
MPKHIIEFNLPEEEDELYLYMAGPRMYQVLWTLTEHFLRRKVNKGEHDYKTADEALQAVWDEIYKLLDDYNVDLDRVS